jgi:hypothetical protein
MRRLTEKYLPLDSAVWRQGRTPTLGSSIIVPYMSMIQNKVNNNIKTGQLLIIIHYLTLQFTNQS